MFIVGIMKKKQLCHGHMTAKYLRKEIIWFSFRKAFIMSSVCIIFIFLCNVRVYNMVILRILYFGGLCRNILSSTAVLLALEIGKEIKWSMVLFLSFICMNSQISLILFKWLNSCLPVGIMIKFSRLLYHSIQWNELQYQIISSLW